MSRPQPWNLTRVCVCALGEASLDDLLDARVAEDILTSPLARAEVMKLIERIRDGKLRGKTALNYAEPDLAPLETFSGQRVLAADDGAVKPRSRQGSLASPQSRCDAGHKWRGGPNGSGRQGI